jgi:hypothetical protein
METHTHIIIIIIIIVMCDQKKSIICRHFITLYLLLILYKGMMINWFNPRHTTKAYEWDTLCFYWCIIILSSTTPKILVRMQQGWTTLKLWWRVVNFTPRPLYCREGNHSTQRIDGCMGHRASLDFSEMSRISSPCRDLTARSFVL